MKFNRQLFKEAFKAGYKEAKRVLREDYDDRGRYIGYFVGNQMFQSFDKRSLSSYYYITASSLSKLIMKLESVKRNVAYGSIFKNRNLEYKIYKDERGLRFVPKQNLDEHEYEEDLKYPEGYEELKSTGEVKMLNPKVANSSSYSIESDKKGVLRVVDNTMGSDDAPTSQQLKTRKPRKTRKDSSSSDDIGDYYPDYVRSMIDDYPYA